MGAGVDADAGADAGAGCGVLALAAGEESDWQRYLARMATLKTWGDELTLRASLASSPARARKAHGTGLVAVLSRSTTAKPRLAVVESVPALCD